MPMTGGLASKAAKPGDGGRPQMAGYANLGDDDDDTESFVAEL